MADSQRKTANGWLHSLRKLGTATDTITTLPADLYADGNNATVGLKGNMSQTGTPSPTTPIQPQECGERTGNLLPLSDKTFTITIGKYNLTVNCSGGNLYFTGTVGEISSSNTAWKTNFAFELEAGTYYCNRPSPLGNGFGRYIKKYSDDTLILGADDYTFTLSETTKCYLSFYIFNRNLDIQLKLMLNVGSTALPYEPWGVKIPISSAGQTTNVYLGEVETTRRVKKLVLTGDENWKLYALPGAVNVERFYVVLSQAAISGGNIVVSTHFPTKTDNSDTEHIRCGGSLSNELYIYISRLVATTIADFKAYLAQQYAAGTPVTVWYVLATEETSVVNEPIRKIGNYADTVSGITIPTITSKDTFDVLTTLKPSEVSLSYTGWHDATVEEWDGSQWNE